MKHTYRQHGFTLLEVMVVVFIIAVISGLSMLSLQQASGRRYLNQADNLLIWLQQLSELAMLEGSAYGVLSNENELHAVVFYRSYWHEAAQPEPFTLYDNAALRLADTSGRLLRTGSKQNIDDDEEIIPEFIFLPDGYIEPVTSIELYFPGQAEKFYFRWDQETSMLEMEMVVEGRR